MAPPKPPPSSEKGEEAFIERIASAVGSQLFPAPDGEVWIGDDCAVVGPDALLLTADACVAGVHADLTLVGLDDVGWKAMTVAISDVAAMGGRPTSALVTVCLPPGLDTDALVAGLVEAAVAWSCPIVGGDVSASGEAAVVVSVTGRCEPPVPPAVLRSGARPGDALFVTGPLGASAAGLRLLRSQQGAPSADEVALISSHRRPRCRIEEGVAARMAGARAMIDVSDGGSLDLHRLAEASGVGFAVDDMPIAPGATLDDALGGGEDYELFIATFDPDALGAEFAARGLAEPIRIGRCTGDTGLRTFQGAPLERRGWEHHIG